MAAGKLDLRSGYPSLRAEGIAGDFRFVMLHRVFSPSTNCRGREAFLLRTHALLRRMSLSDQDAYGLDTSVVVRETVPLIINTAAPRRIRPADTVETTGSDGMPGESTGSACVGKGK